MANKKNNKNNQDKSVQKKNSGSKKSKIKIDNVETISNEEQIQTSSIENIDKGKQEIVEKNTNAPATKASTVFSNIASYNWWKKLAYVNMLFTVGITFFIMSFVWVGQEDRKIANIIFSSIILSVSLISIATIIIFYFLKRIKCYCNIKKWLSIAFSFMPLGFIAILVCASLEEKRFYDDEKVKSMGYKKPKFVMPHVYVILLSMIFLIVFASWIITWTGSTGANNNKAPAGILFVLLAPIQGFIDAADLVIFLLIMGGFLAIVTESQALDAGLGRMIKKMKGKEIYLVPILFVLFSTGGATYGMAEETLPFYLLLIPVFLVAGFDTYTAFITILLGAGLGTAASILNPFVVNTAVGAFNDAIKNNPDYSHVLPLSPSDGIAFRAIIYVLLIISGATFCTFYAYRVKKNQKLSVVYAQREDDSKHFSFDIDSLPDFTWRRKLILVIFGLAFTSMIISVVNWEGIIKTNPFESITNWIDKYLPFLGGINKDGSSLFGSWGTWYLEQMSFLFLFGSLLVGALSWKGSKHFISKFMSGAADFMGVAIVIAISRGISKAVSSTGLDNVIIQSLSSLMNSIGNAYLIIIMLFIIFFALSFLIPSTSGFAGAIFPIIGPAIAISNVPGLTVSGAISIFATTSGFVNVTMPSGGIFMSGLSLSRISIGTFYKQAWWFLLSIMLGTLCVLLIGQALNAEAGLNLF